MIETVPETTSTNSDLVARLAGGERVPEGSWLVADRQSAGKGRQGRRWLDAPGNFMGSTVVRVSAHDPAPASLSFVAALATFETVLPGLGSPYGLQLKWPNDLLLNGAKLAGILLERSGDSAVVGIGVNLAGAPVLENRLARHLAETGPAPDRDAFARALATNFAHEVARWRSAGLEALLARWQAAAHPVGTPLSVHEADGSRISGRFDGLGPDGALRLMLTGGAVRTVHAGDVSLEEAK
ncbi:biotin--[acetyl-CoA-carboxylase] ligase [Altericroceibacterium xinjiangense]|uniref:biotin--[acetyl-CoA-carboxylase] ligase n=1 Tax=Altericroceibacterium xinjiangense TaxID=762261 RepID=UPI000F7DEB42|nr:biotin--[acetyl-CoA-carboxylase] ligase [Altericroceibacterium xinjiangense]